ncbi:MAG TPA: dienelactone hydrolase family protein [Candidatus Nitrosotalea sp.]|nr:dienelactone hydrolase family protein [Candidatus Nitrosotalea sp.]
MPRDARGLVLFAHGSGSSRFSPRNAFVAGMLAEGRLASLLLDLLTPDEEKIDAKTAALRFDIGMLASRLVAATRWTRTQPALEHLQIGYFGASTGAAAALVAAAMLRDEIRAIVSRGGRPDLAGAYLSRVAAPTLLIVGGNDDMVIELNNQAARQMSAPHRIAIVPGATHLFEEPGTLATAARLAREWFEVHL